MVATLSPEKIAEFDRLTGNKSPSQPVPIAITPVVKTSVADAITRGKQKMTSGFTASVPEADAFTSGDKLAPVLDKGNPLGNYIKGFAEVAKTGSEEVKKAPTVGEGLLRTVGTVGAEIGQALSPVAAPFQYVADKLGIKEGMDTVTKAIADKITPDIREKLQEIGNMQLSEQTTKDLERAGLNLKAVFNLINFLGPEIVKKGGTTAAAGMQEAATVAKPAIEATTAAATAAKDAVTTAGKTVADKATSPFKGSYRPEIAALFESEGITPPVSAVTKSQFVQGAESISAKGPMGKKILETYDTAKSAIESKTAAVVEKLKPLKTVSDENLGRTLQEGLIDNENVFKKSIEKVRNEIYPKRTASAEVLGKELQKGLKDYEINFKDTQEKIYKKFNGEYGSLKLQPQNTRTMLEEIITQQSQDFYKGVDSRLRAALEKLQPAESPILAEARKTNSPDVVKALQTQGKLPPEPVYPELTFDQLKQTRTSVGEALTRDPENTALKRLYGALTRDMDATVTQADSAAGDKLAKMSADYEMGKNKIEGRLASSIEQSNPERIVDNLLERNSADSLKVLKEMIGKDKFQAVSDEFIRRAFDTADEGGRFSADKFKEFLNQYDPETVMQLIPDINTRLKIQRVATQLEGLETSFSESRSKIGTALSGNPERIAQNLLNRDSAELVKQVKQIVGPEKFSEVSKTFMRDLFEGSVTRDKFDIKKLKKKLASYDEATLTEILDKPQREALDDAIGQLDKLDTMNTALKPGEKFTAGSQTAYLQAARKFVGTPGTVGFLLLSGQPALAAIALGELATEYIGSKMFTTDLGRKLITEGLYPRGK